MVPMSEPASAVAGETESEVPGRSSFEEFFSAEHRGLYGALVLVTRSSHEAEEVMQDAFLRVWERWDRVAGLDDPVGYLYRTAMNLFRSRLRRAAVAVRKTLHQLPPDDGLAAVESRDSVVRALAPLTPRQRAAVVLMDVLDFTSEQAGLEIGRAHV